MRGQFCENDVEEALDQMRERGRLLIAGVILSLAFSCILLVAGAVFYWRHESTASASTPSAAHSRDRLAVRDAKGVERASLEVEDDGLVRLRLLDGAGRPSLVLGVTEGGDGALAIAQPTTQARASLVVTNRAELVLSFADSKGTNRATILVDKSGSPSVSMSDEAGVMRAAMSLSTDGLPRLTQYDEAGVEVCSFGSETKGRTSLTLGNSGDGCVTLETEAGAGTGLWLHAPGITPVLAITTDSAGSPTIRLLRGGITRSAWTLHPSGISGIGFSDVRGTVRAMLGVDDSGRPSLQFADDRNRQRLLTMLSESGNPVLSLLDAMGNVRSSLALSRDGFPSLLFRDRNRFRMVLGAGASDSRNPEESSLMLFGGDGELLWSAP